MKKNILIILLLVMSTFCYSQRIRTIFANDSSTTVSYGGYGAPLINVTNFHNDWGLIIGGKGGIIINRKFIFGGVGMGMVSNHKFIGNDLSDNMNAPLQLSFGAGGIFVEYVFNIKNPVHFSIPLNIMAGGVSVNYENTDDVIESSSIFILEPGFNLEFNFTKFFIPTINISYRNVIGSSLINLDDKNLSGLNIGLILKFGSF